MTKDNRDGNRWEFFIDRGGTFTDVVARNPQGEFTTYKLLSSDEAPLLAIRKILDLSPEEPIPPLVVKLGSTVGTNALLERKGRDLYLATTKGFRDLLSIGYQNRPHLFSLDIEKTLPLYRGVVEIDERIDRDGTILKSPDKESVRRTLQAVLNTGIDSLAISFLHSYLYPEHEEMVAEIARDLGFSEVTCSSKVSPQIKIVARGDTTTLDAYLTPILKDYLQYLSHELPESDLRIMQSNGGLVQAENFQGKDSLLSGPAGGVVGYARTAEMAGIGKVIGFDMGGTSTDVSRYDGEFEMIYEREIAGIRVQSPLINIETVAAGGGSLIEFDGISLQVGPESAGAVPGPICYGQGGEKLALTDANLLLGRIVPDYFDKFPLQVEKVRQVFEDLAEKMSRATGREISPVQAALGAVDIANNNMVSALRVISVARGYDPREYALATFGGAGGQHACALARQLGISTILIHPFAGVLSALGIGMADIKMDAEQTVNMAFEEENFPQIEKIYKDLEEKVTARLEEDPSLETHRLERLVDMRYKGQSSQLTVAWKEEETSAAFEEKHKERFGHSHQNRPLEIVTLRLEGIGQTGEPPQFNLESGEGSPPVESHTEVYFEEEPQKTAIYLRKNLLSGHVIEGPALVIDADLTLLVEPDFRARIDSQGFIILENREREEKREEVSCQRDPIQLEIFNRLFSSVAEQMGEALANTAFSTNIKERLDFSCALFDPQGGLVANAAHIPVHLGAMSEAVRGLIESGKPLAKGDIYISNNPFCGGSHLPDVTVITPVFDEGEEEIVFFVANRGHHADIGGKVPGSMPAFSTSIEEEGVLIDNFRLVHQGESQMEKFKEILLRKPYPVRDIDERISDTEAQIAANVKGVELLEGIIEKYTLSLVQAYMEHMRDSAREKMEDLLESYPDGIYSFEDFLDEGHKIALEIEIKGKKATLDFAGTSSQVEGNLNANTAITKSAILYVFRTLLEKEIPLNAGCLEPFDIRIPKGSLLHPEGKVAVVGGNVETSQRICDVLLGAMGAAGASQGTMNNFTFGDENFGYYETIAGGSGAGKDFDGAHGVHTHMTNTRMTDPEVFENRYPAVLEEVSYRSQSGGWGQHRGGWGLYRRVKFNKKVEVSLLTERRNRAPYGLEGGKEGKKGANYLLRQVERDGKKEYLSARLGGKAKFTVYSGDKVVMKTPGGGGYGSFSKRDTYRIQDSQGAFEWEGEKPSQEKLVKLTSKVEELRLAMRQGRYTGPTAGLAPGFVQANLVILPGELAEDFRHFCLLNSQACPLLEETAPGSTEAGVFAPRGDLRTDLPQYYVCQKGKIPWPVTSLRDFWREDLVSFLLGCSFTFEEALLKAGIPLRHIEEKKNVSMYLTNRSTEEAGPFAGPLVVSMRPVPEGKVEEVAEITSRFPLSHGRPVHWGDPSQLGIEDLRRPDYGDPVEIKEGEVPVFWACGVTPMKVLRESGIDFYITHRPGHMLITSVFAGI